MAQRKPPPSGKPAAKSTAPKASAATSAKSSSTAAKATATKAGARPPTKKPGKSIVNQKQTPWGMIGVTAAIVVFAIVIVVAVVVTRKSDSSSDPKDRYRLPEVAAAKAIKDIRYHVEPNHTHVSAPVKYDTTPPTGGNHSQIWADCDGTVYPNAIANENAVHMLEHGAVWITYNPDLPKAQVATLAKLVNGVDRMAMSPYPDLKTPISLQSWGYQLFVNSASDSRIQAFIDALRFNPDTTPENAAGVTCSDPQFKASPSTFGNPQF